MSTNLEPGTTIPDFMLPDENGELHRRIKPDFDPTTPKARARWEQSRRVTAAVV